MREENWLARHIGKIWGFAGAIMGLAATVTLAAVALTPADFAVARVGLVVSIGVLMIAIALTVASTSWPFWQRVPIAFLLCGGVGIILAEGLRWISHRESLSIQSTEAFKLYFTAEHAAFPKNARGIAAIYELSVGSPSGVGSVGRIFQPDAAHDLDGYGKADAIRCELTNYGNDPLANVT